MHLIDFQPFCIREITFVTSCLFSCTPSISEKGLLYMERVLFSLGANAFFID